MKMRHWICAAALSGGLLIGGAAASSIHATSVEIEDTKKQAPALEEEKKKVESTLSQLEGLKIDTAACIRKLNGNLFSLAEELEQLEDRAVPKEGEIDQAQIQLESVKREEEHQYDDMKLYIKYMYENDQNDLLDMTIGFGNTPELPNRAEYVSQIAEYDRKMLIVYASAKGQVAVGKQNLEKGHDEFLVPQESTQTKQVSVQKLMDSKQRELDSHNSKIAIAQDKLGQHDADIKTQKEQTRRIEAGTKRREEETRKKAEVVGKTYIVSNLGNISFKWSRPSSSRITSNFGDRESPTEGVLSSRKGIDISANIGAGIIAVTGGEAVISTCSYSVDNYIMLDHEDRVSTVHIHCFKLLMGVGEKATGDQVITEVGSIGYSTGSHLHFGIRLGGIYVNPRGYINPWPIIG